jgi:tetratricopeptide (TPR) repeat protein/TolB-like protein
MNPTVVSAPDEETVILNGIPGPEIRSQLERILRSRAFIQSHRIRRFLQFIVEESLLGQPHRLKEYLIGLEVFDRRDAFDPRVDSIVRVEARRLRHKLEEYYRSEGREDLIRITLRKGSYVPIFEPRTAAPSLGILEQRRAIAIAPLAVINPHSDAEPVAEEIRRRLAHVLIREGCFQVISKSPEASPTNGSNGGGNGHASTANRPDFVVEGSLELRQDDFHLILQLARYTDRSYIWSGAVDGQVGDLSPVEQMARSLVSDLMTPSSDIAMRRHSAHKESLDFYLEGRYFWKLATPDNIRQSVNLFSKAVESDQNYAAALAALAEALLVSSMFGLFPPSATGPRMKEAAAKATALDPSLPEGHVALGSILSIVDWDWTAGEQELEKAIQLDHHDPVGHLAYGIHLACRGQLDNAMVEIERALELDPASLFPNFILGWLHGVSRRFDEAIAQHSLVARLAPDYGLPQLGLGLAFAGKGQFTDAIAHFTNASQMKCRSLLHGQMGYCYARAGRADEAQRELASLGIRTEENYVSPVSFASIYAGMENKEKTLEALEQAVALRDTSLPMQLLGTEFDLVRHDPRFVDLRKKIGLA